MNRKIEEICFCAHGRESHIFVSAYSKAESRVIITDLCHARACRCKHFQPTPFKTASGMIESEEKPIKEKRFAKAKEVGPELF